MINSPRVYVQVQSMYTETQSQPEKDRYVFAYIITLRNLGRRHVQLIRRYWLITNANGLEIEVQGEGVVCEKKPRIFPGGEFQYTSGAVLETPFGTMQGHYDMVNDQGQRFHVAIPVFRLAIPSLIN